MLFRSLLFFFQICTVYCVLCFCCSFFRFVLCFVVIVVVVGVVSVIFGAGDRKQERKKKTLFYTMRSEQLLPQMGELLFIRLANLPV